MVQGVDEVDGLIFVGYHARAGSPDAILDHTWSSKTVANVWLNDILVGEYGLNAAVAGHFDVPALMVTGDQTACAQTVELLGEVETAIVKRATGRYAAECLPPKVAQAMIQKAAAQAVARLARGKAPSPFILDEPIFLSVEFNNSAMADHAMRMPGAERDGTCVSLSLPDMVMAYNAFRGMVALATMA
jgi:D-amino peptidase